MTTINNIISYDPKKSYLLSELKKIAKLMGLKKYSKLRKYKLRELLNSNYNSKKLLNPLLIPYKMCKICKICKKKINKKYNQIIRNCGCFNYYHFECFKFKTILQTEKCIILNVNLDECSKCFKKKKKDEKEEKKEEEDEICPICLESIVSDLKITKCNHKFHGQCIKLWDIKKKGCPYCRSKN